MPLSLDKRLEDSNFSIVNQALSNWTLNIPIGDSNDLEWIPMSTFIVLLLGIFVVLNSITPFHSKKTVKFKSVKQKKK